MKALTGLVLCLLLAGCQSWWRPESVLLQLSPADLGRQLAIVQKITAGHGPQRDVMLAHIEISRERLAMAGTTPDGQLLFQLQLRDGVLSSETARWAPAAINPAHILSDFQLSFWPADIIRTALPAGWHLDDSRDGRQRTLLQGDTPVISIRYGAGDHWSHAVQFTHHRWHYQLTIETVSMDAL